MTVSPPPNRSRRGLLRRLAGWAVLAGGAGLAHAGGAARPKSGDRVVYHIDELANAIAMIRNLSNHLDARPASTIVVVAISKALPMLVSGTQGPNGNDYEALVNDLQRRGVLFKACGNTMESLQISADDLHWDVVIVPSGMAELARLQAEEGYAYLKV